MGTCRCGHLSTCECEEGDMAVRAPSSCAVLHGVVRAEAWQGFCEAKWWASSRRVFPSPPQRKNAGEIWRGATARISSGRENPARNALSGVDCANACSGARPRCSPWGAGWHHLLDHDVNVHVVAV